MERVSRFSEIEYFENVYVDDQLVDPENYAVTEGSTIITFKEEYLATLGSGEHKVTIEFTNGVAETKFELEVLDKEPEEEPEVKPEKPLKPSWGNLFKDFFDNILGDNKPGCSQKPQLPQLPQVPQLDGIVTIIKNIFCWWK